MATLNVTIDPTGAVAGGAVVENTIRDIRDETRTLATAVKRNVDTAFQRATRRSGRNLRGLGSEVKRVISGVSRLTGILSIGGGASLGFAFVRGLQGAEKFSVAVSELSAITGATGQDLEFLSDAAREMGATSIFSATQAAQGFQLIASAKPELLENRDALREVTEQSLLLAAAAGITLPQAADISATALNQFGAAANQANRFVNVLAAGSKFGASLITETAVALKNAGVSARNAGVDFEEANAAIQVFARDGIKGGEAGTALRNILLKLEQQADTFKPSVQGLSGSLRNLAAQELTTTELTRLFGLENVNAAQSILRNVDLLDALTDTLTGTDVATEQARRRFDNLTGDLRALSSAIEEGFISDYQEIEPFLRGFVQGLTQLARGEDRYSAAVKARQVAQEGAYARINRLIEEEKTRLEGLEVVRRNATSLSEITGNASDLRPAQSGVENYTDRINALSQELDDARVRLGHLTIAADNLSDRSRSGNIFGSIFGRTVGNEELQNARAIFGEFAGLRDYNVAIQNTSQLMVDLRREIGELEEARSSAAETAANAAAEEATSSELQSDRLQELYAERQALIEQGLAEHAAEVAKEHREVAAGFREAAAGARLLREEQSSELSDAFDPLSEFRALNLPQLARRTRRLRADLRTPQEELDFQREFLELLNERGVLSDELHSRAIAQAEERFQAASREGDPIQEQIDAYNQLVASLDPLIAAQQEYQESNSLLDEIEKNRATLGIDLAEILEARVLVENRLAEAIEGVTDATSAQEQAQRQVISRYLPLRRAQQQYEQALQLIEDANLGVIASEKAKSAALREYASAVDSANGVSRNYADETRRGFEDVQSSVDQFTNNFSSAITDALTGGEASFSNFFDSIERMIVERFSQQFIAEPLNQLINNLIGGSGGGGGGFFGGILSSIFGGGSSGPSYEELYPTDILGFRQYGGVARPGRTYLVGEAGPEILRQGVTGGYVTPIRGQQSAGIQPAEVRVEVNNYNSDQSNVEIAERTGPDGEQVIEVAVLNAVDRSIASGALDSRLGLYGARRETIPRG